MLNACKLLGSHGLYGATEVKEVKSNVKCGIMWNGLFCVCSFTLFFSSFFNDFFSLLNMSFVEYALCMALCW